MSALPKRMSLDEFLDWEERQELRYEYDGVSAQAMTGGTVAHADLLSNLMGILSARQRGGPCRVYGQGLKVRTSTSVRYPDVFVVCAPRSAKATVSPDPIVIFEILSPSTARIDLGAKNAEYQTLETLRRYVVLRQDTTFADVFFRDTEGEWTHEQIGVDGALNMPEIGVEVPLSELYEGVQLP